MHSCPPSARCWIKAIAYPILASDDTTNRMFNSLTASWAADISQLRRDTHGSFSRATQRVTPFGIVCPKKSLPILILCLIIWIILLATIKWQYSSYRCHCTVCTLPFHVHVHSTSRCSHCGNIPARVSELYNMSYGVVDLTYFLVWRKLRFSACLWVISPILGIPI